jgi:FkbM family methyltransferase
MKYNVSRNCQVGGLGKIYTEVFGYKTDGSFVEVGAHDGLSWSNTSCLAEAGWKGLMFEPVPKFYNKCAQRYQNNKNVSVFKCCIGDYNGEVKVYLGGSLSTTSPEMIKVYNNLEWSKHIRHNEKKFINSKIYTLNHVFEKHGWPANFDVLVVDTEGTELQVLNGLDIGKWTPRMAIIEAHEKHKDKVLGKNAAQINELFESRGYKKIYCDIVNSIFLREDSL